MTKPNLDHPTLPRVKSQFTDRSLFATEFRGETTLVIQPGDLHSVMRFLRTDEQCQYDFLSDIVSIDYLNYPETVGGPTGRFGIVYNLVSTIYNRRLFIKVLLDPSIDTSGIEADPALHLDSVTDIWPGAEWLEREAYDMIGVRFNHHPDMRRILLWESFPAFPMRKDYPVEGRGERETYHVVDRDSA